MSIGKRTPSAVRAAGVLTGLQGLAGVALSVALVVRVLQGAEYGGKILGAVGVLVILFAGVLAAAVGLWRGRRWARSPVVVTQLLLLGSAWYAYSSSGQQLMGALGGFYCVGVLALLFTTPARAWALGLSEDGTPDTDD